MSWTWAFNTLASNNIDSCALDGLIQCLTGFICVQLVMVSQSKQKLTRLGQEEEDEEAEE